MAPEWITFGILLVVQLIVSFMFRFYENFYSSSLTSNPRNEKQPERFSNEVPWKLIGGSSIELTQPISVVPIKDNQPIFTTLRLQVEEIDRARWKFKIKFVVINSLKQTIVIDDIHARLYEKNVPTPTFATIEYVGEVLLLQDNSICKDNLQYSLASNDGYEITLVLEMTRVEGSSAYGIHDMKPGPVRTVFGLFIDYYFLDISVIERKSVPSDCLYLFEYNTSQHQLKALDSDAIEQLKHHHSNDREMLKAIQRLDSLFKEHSAFQPIPKT